MVPAGAVLRSASLASRGSSRLLPPRRQACAPALLRSTSAAWPPFRFPGSFVSFQVLSAPLAEPRRFLLSSSFSWNHAFKSSCFETATRPGSLVLLGPLATEFTGHGSEIRKPACLKSRAASASSSGSKNARVLRWSSPPRVPTAASDDPLSHPCRSAPGARWPVPCPLLPLPVRGRCQRRLEGPCGPSPPRPFGKTQAKAGEERDTPGCS